MDNTNYAAELLFGAAQEYVPCKVAEGIVQLQELGLFVGIRQVQVMQSATKSLFISEITASARAREKGITVTCVGLGDDMSSAVANAVAQWAMGVLPVLAYWRGKHSCLSNCRQIETQGGAFELLAGPVAEMGRPEANSPTAAGGRGLIESLSDVLRSHRAAQRVHWLELYACNMNDGSVDATCRLDNRDWMPGRKVLLEVAASWPTVKSPLQSSRQFAMLVPGSGDGQEIVVPGFFARLLGRA
jgi:hypothetical protein